MMVWFKQRGRKIAWVMEAKFWLMIDGFRSGNINGGLVRLTTPILPGESDADADARLRDAMEAVVGQISRFIPGA